ncbi:MAG: hypothetical protein QM728_01780 [Gordonia sp. (in: high G+C Gram-positive bacteria)]|uniref:hypothetical protein n=1 Tax=Gordonia sp. (in: high G+C Gram-positive bacteria) TaxID=84139 RepID=UPI0039E5C1ED
MIPTDWQPHYRSSGHHSEGELVGYLKPADDDLVVPVNLVGWPLAEATDVDEASELLDGLGLSSLIDRWELIRPGSDPLRVSIVEVDGERVRLQTYTGGAIGGEVEEFILDVPVSSEVLVRL